MPTGRGTIDEPEQDEHEEYAEIVRQLAQFRREHATMPASAPHGVASLVSRPVVTCDNSQYPSDQAGQERDRRGVLLSVPIYDQDSGAFKGLVTSVVRLNVLEARLVDWPLVPVTAPEWARMRELGLEQPTPAEYVLTQSTSGIAVSDRRNGALQDILAGKAVAGLTLNKPLEIPSQPDWVLTRHVPQLAFDQIHAAARHSIVIRSAVALAVLAAFAVVAWLLSSQRRNAAQLKEMAEFDPLTGLPNRRQLDRRLDAGLRLAQVDGSPLALVMIDLDNFKSVNDTHGHGVGDMLLTEVARRFQKQLRADRRHARGSDDPRRRRPPSAGSAATNSVVLLPRMDVRPR